MRRRGVFGQFLEDLLEGDPVALTVGGILAVVALGLLTAVFLVIRAKKREDEELKERRKRRGY